MKTITTIRAFDYTNDGWLKAEKYLKSVGKLEEFNNNKTSTDGYSLIHYANDVYQRLNRLPEIKYFPTLIIELQEGMRVYDDELKAVVMIEKAEESYILLDKTFGRSTHVGAIRERYIKEHGDDGRYSISWGEVKDRLFFNQVHIKS